MTISKQNLERKIVNKSLGTHDLGDCSFSYKFIQDLVQRLIELELKSNNLNLIDYNDVFLNIDIDHDYNKYEVMVYYRHLEYDSEYEARIKELKRIDEVLEQNRILRQKRKQTRENEKEAERNKRDYEYFLELKKRFEGV